MTFDFSNVAARSIDGRTAEYPLIELREDPKPVLILRPAGSENRAFFNAMLARVNQTDRRALRTGHMSADQLDRARVISRELYPAHIIAGWRHLKDVNGVEVPFSTEAAKELFAKLPDHILDGITNFCGEPTNFLDRTPVDAEAVAGN